MIIFADGLLSIDTNIKDAITIIKNNKLKTIIEMKEKIIDFLVINNNPWLSGKKFLNLYIYRIKKFLNQFLIKFCILSVMFLPYKIWFFVGLLIIYGFRWNGFFNLFFNKILVIKYNSKKTK